MTRGEYHGPAAVCDGKGDDDFDARITDTYTINSNAEVT